MHDTLLQGVKSIRTLLQRIMKYLQQELNNWHGITHYNCHDLKEDLMGTKILLLYLSNMLSTIGVKELRLST